MKKFTLFTGLFLLCGHAFAQGTAFTYQGRLNDGANPANGIYNLRFAIYDSPSAGIQQGIALTNAATGVTNGLFTVSLDFGNHFSGADRWLEIAACTNTVNSFVTLAPRQKLTPTPYAVTAGNILSGGIAAGTYGNPVAFSNSTNSFTGSFTGNGVALTNVNAATLGGRSASQFWTTTGNSNTVAGANFLGTRDFQPLELWAGGLRVLRLEPDTRGDIAGNLIGGSTNNTIGQPGSGGNVIGGGGYRFGPQIIYSNTSGVFIGAGSANQIGPNVNDSFIGAGFGNSIQALGAFIGSGEQNTIQPLAVRAVIVGGQDNTNGGSLSVIVGGALNKIGSLADESFIGGGSQNQIVGSALNQVAGTIGGGSLNFIFTNGTLGTIAGGLNNNIQPETDGGTIGGGYNGSVAGDYATIPGGSDNWANGFASFAAGRRAKANHDGAFVWADSQDADFSSTATNQFSVRAKGGVRFETAGAGLQVDGQPVVTGNAALLNTNQTFTGQNTFNNSVSINATLSANTVAPAGTLSIAGDLSLSGGATTYHNLSMSGGNSAGYLYGSFPNLGDGIHLGYNWYADNAGVGHTINAGGGTSRISSGYGSIVLATGSVGFSPINRVTVDANGNVGIGRTSAGNRLEVEGNASKTLSGSWLANSDARIKQDIRTVTNALETLDRVHLVSFRYTDSYRAAHPAAEDRRYLNVVAQEFREVFPDDVKSSGEKLPDGSEILQVDTYPLTIYSAAAIQELNQKLEDKERRIQELEQAVGELLKMVRQKNFAGE